MLGMGNVELEWSISTWAIHDSISAVWYTCGKFSFLDERLLTQLPPTEGNGFSGDSNAWRQTRVAVFFALTTSYQTCEKSLEDGITRANASEED